MLRRDSSFKISKQTKRTMATMTDKTRANVYREMMIKAQIDGSKEYVKKAKGATDED